MRSIAFREALREAMNDEMRRDERVWALTLHSMGVAHPDTLRAHADRVAAYRKEVQQALHRAADIIGRAPTPRELGGHPGYLVDKRE